MSIRKKTKLHELKQLVSSAHSGFWMMLQSFSSAFHSHHVFLFQTHALIPWGLNTELTSTLRCCSSQWEICFECKFQVLQQQKTACLRRERKSNYVILNSVTPSSTCTNRDVKWKGKAGTATANLAQKKSIQSEKGSKTAENRQNMLGYQMRCGTKCMIMYVKSIVEHGRSLNSDNLNI